jgi:hypothetical protein
MPFIGIKTCGTTKILRPLMLALLLRTLGVFVKTHPAFERELNSL